LALLPNELIHPRLLNLARAIGVGIGSMILAVGGASGRSAVIATVLLSRLVAPFSLKSAWKTRSHLTYSPAPKHLVFNIALIVNHLK
jgi:hypothetical protein